MSQSLSSRPYQEEPDDHTKADEHGVPTMTSLGASALTVDDVMSGDMVAVRQADEVAEVRSLLVGAAFHALPVLDDNGDAVGIVTLADLDGISELAAVESAMTSPVSTIEAQATVREAAELMRAEFIHHLVVTEEGRTVGLLSSFDLLYCLVDE